MLHTSRKKPLVAGPQPAITRRVLLGVGKTAEPESRTLRKSVSENPAKRVKKHLPDKAEGRNRRGLAGRVTEQRKPKRRPNETFSKGHGVWDGTDYCDGAPSVSAKISPTKCGDSTSDESPAKGANPAKDTNPETTDQPQQSWGYGSRCRKQIRNGQRWQGRGRGRRYAVRKTAKPLASREGPRGKPSNTYRATNLPSFPLSPSAVDDGAFLSQATHQQNHLVTRKNHLPVKRRLFGLPRR